MGKLVLGVTLAVGKSVCRAFPCSACADARPGSGLIAEDMLLDETSVLAKPVIDLLPERACRRCAIDGDCVWYTS